MNLKQKFVYVAVGGVLTLVCYAVITLSVGVLNPKNASAQESDDIPTIGQIKADLLGKRIEVERNWKWYDVYSVENFVSFDVQTSTVYEYAVEYDVIVEMWKKPEGIKMTATLYIAYRKTDTGWELASVKNLNVL